MAQSDEFCVVFYSYVHNLSDGDTVFAVLPLYITTVDFVWKSSNQVVSQKGCINCLGIN